MPDECASMRSIARCVLPVLVGPSTAVTPAPRAYDSRAEAFESEIDVTRMLALYTEPNQSRIGYRLSSNIGVQPLRHKPPVIFHDRTGERMHDFDVKTKAAAFHIFVAIP